LHVDVARGEFALEVFARAARSFDLHWLSDAERQSEVDKHVVLVDEVTERPGVSRADPHGLARLRRPSRGGRMGITKVILRS
jgi:hypothetical protein